MLSRKFPISAISLIRLRFNVDQAHLLSAGVPGFYQMVRGALVSPLGGGCGSLWRRMVWAK